MLTPSEVAKQLTVTPATVLRWCHAGKIEAIRLPSGQWRIRQAVVDRILTPVEVDVVEDDEVGVDADSAGSVDGDVPPGQGKLL